MSKKADPRIQRTRELFEQALLELIGMKEFKKITVQEIANKSSLNRATFYLHYFDKDDLLEQMMQEAINELKDNLKIHEAEFLYSPVQSHPTLVRLFEHVMENAKFYKLMLVEEKFSFFTEAIETIIHKMVSEGTSYMLNDEIDYRVPVEMAVSYYASAYFGMVVWWLKQDMPYTPKYMASQLTALSTVGPYVKNPYME